MVLCVKVFNLVFPTGTPSLVSEDTDRHRHSSWFPLSNKQRAVRNSPSFWLIWLLISDTYSATRQIEVRGSIQLFYSICRIARVYKSCALKILIYVHFFLSKYILHYPFQVYLRFSVFFRWIMSNSRFPSSSFYIPYLLAQPLPFTLNPNRSFCAAAFSLGTSFMVFEVAFVLRLLALKFCVASNVKIEPTSNPSMHLVWFLWQRKWHEENCSQVTMLKFQNVWVLSSNHFVLVLKQFC